MKNEFYPFTNLPLPYAYDALEPFIDTKTMQLHHDRHLQTYIDKLNAALEATPLFQKLSLEQLIMVSANLPEIHNNAGGVYNHRFFFDGMKNPSKPEGEILNVIQQQFGSLDDFYATFKKAALSVFGSGYAWLALCGGKLYILTTANQDTPLAQNFKPLLALDVWEHAYYLKHYNQRADYIDDFFKVIDWQQVNQRYLDSLMSQKEK